MKPTIKDIAKLTGFSVATVSLVLNGKDSRISQETRNQIIEKANALGYRPNSTAVSLRTRRSFTIGLLIPDLRNEYYAYLAKGVEDYCQQNGWCVILCSTNNSAAREREYIETLIDKNVDGIAIDFVSGESEDISSENVELLMNSNIPVVFHDLAFSNSQTNAVVGDDEHGGYLGTKHLLSLGHRDILFVTGSHWIKCSQMRSQGAKAAFAEFGLPWREDMVIESDYSYEGGYRTLEKAEGKHYTAIFAYNDMMAYGIYEALQQRNLRIPEDISVVGYDDLFVSSQLRVPLTTIKMPIYDIGMESARILISSSLDRKLSTVSKFNVELVVRESTRQL